MRIVTSLAVTALILSSGVAAAQNVSFEGKTITINIGSSTGGGLDTYARLVARHLGKHVPGTPSVVASNVPGAGGNIAASRIFNIAPKDGTHIGMTFPTVMIDPLLAENARPDFDPNKFQYVGSAHSEVLVCIVRRDKDVDAPKDILEKELTIGSTAPGSTTSSYPNVSNGILDAKFKIISGYKGSREVTFAVERNEIDGICGVGWSTIKVQIPDILEDSSFARVFAQEDATGSDELNKAGIPLMIDVAANDEDRATMEWFYLQNSFARPLILPPETPAEVVETLRAAFDATMKDPELLAEAEQMGIDVHPRSGAEVQQIIARMYEAPQDMVARVRDAVAGKK